MTLKVGALWVREAKDKDGNTFKYFSGVLQTLERDIPIVVFKNKRKERDNHPDYLVYRSDPKKEGTPTDVPVSDLTDDIPF